MYRPDRELLRLLPKVLRARDYHLYLENGKRLTDLWLQGGRAVLGHKPPRVLGELKNAAERGLFTPLPHPLEKRFLKAMRGFFPGRAFRLYMDDASLYRALSEAGFAGTSPCDAAPFSDPAFPPGSYAEMGSNAGTNGIAEAENDTRAERTAGTDSATGKASVSLWRPFVESLNVESPGGNEQNAQILIPVLPWPLGPAVLVLDESLDSSFPESELIPPVLLAPAARALYDLAAAMKAHGADRQRYYKIEKVLGEKKSSETKSKESYWRRRGIYLTTNVGKEKYEALFKHFLEGGFLLPPSANEPLILPSSMSKGEETKLAELLGFFLDGNILED